MQNTVFKLSNRMRENLSTLIMSVLLALIVWFFAIDQENPLVRQEFDQPVSVEVLGLAEGTQTLQDLTKRNVFLTLRAPQSTWENISPDDFNAYIDLSGRQPGIYEVPIIVDPVDTEVSVVDQQPRQLRVQIEELITKTVPIQVEVMDSPAFSYEAQEALIEPETATISGPRTQVEQVNSAVAEVFLRSAKSQVERTQSLSPRSAQNLAVDRVTVEPQNALVVVPIVQRPGRKEVAVVVTVEGQPAPGYRLTSISSDPGTVILRGSPEALLEVGGFVETPVLNIENATSDVRERLPLILPANISTLGDASVTAEVTISPIVSSIPLSRPPIIQGLDSSLRAIVSLARIDVIVSGPLPRLDAINSDDVRVTLDLSGLLPGSHVVVPSIIAPEGISVEGVIPQAVEVTIESLVTPEPTRTNAATPSPPGGTIPVPTPSPTTTPEGSMRPQRVPV
jgi:YbbR domain-containing protein